MKVGQKVVCIKSGWVQSAGEKVGGEIHPKKGDIVTISRTSHHPKTKELYLSFEEHGNRDVYHHENFRPVDESFGKKVTEELEKQFVPLEIGEQVEAILKICGVAEAKAMFEQSKKSHRGIIN